MPLDQQLPNLTRAVLKQSLTKSIQTKEKSFQLLKAIVEVGEGGLETQAGTVASSVQKAFASTAVTTTSTGSTTAVSLAATVLSFLAAYFANHPVSVYSESLPQIVPCVVKAMSDKYQRTSIEAFNAASSLARGVRPNLAASSTIAPLPASQVAVIKAIFDATCEVLAGTTADSEVKEKATTTLGDLLVCEADALAKEVDQALPLVTARVNTEATQLAALQVVGKVAESSICRGAVFDKWFLAVLDVLPMLFKKSARGVKPMALSTLNKVLARYVILAEYRNLELTCYYRTGDKLPKKTVASLVTDLKVFISPSDITNLPYALTVLTSMLKFPKASAKAAIEKDILPEVISLIKSTSTHGPSLEALQDFIAAYTAIDPDSATRMVPGIVKVFDVRQPVSAIATAGEGSTATYATAAKCIGVILKNTQENFAGILSQFIKPVQVWWLVYAMCVVAD
jgi:cullin-associated NEDD8-dissociated protein 1